MELRQTMGSLCIASTFTAEPSEEGLRFWLERLGVPPDITYAPYGQLFQSLLDPSSELGRNRRGANVLLIRWGDLSDTQAAPVEDLANALRESCERCQVPHFIVTGPPEPDSGCDERALDADLRARISHSGGAGIPLAYMISGQEVLERYPVAEIFDADAHRVGHVPYTEAFFAALSTTIVRALYCRESTPRKVIVLDCDNTLWDGVVGEEGPDGVGLTGAFTSLQSLCVQHAEQGKLLCLASKNVEADVWSVFDERDMPLKRDHVTAHRINWLAKSQNLRSLAQELGLGLDSFVFIDDSPVECAEVRAACPEVLTVELPPDASARPRLLQHLWALDQLRVTSEDQKRAQTYKDNAARGQLAAAAGSLETFLQQLELTITIEVARPDDVPRIAQLSQRTNQMNATTRRRDEGEVRALLERGSPAAPGERSAAGGDRLCRVVRVGDRFGDYGLVGVMMATSDDAALTVDTFLLSCRALGRGVEQEMMAHLGRFAEGRALPEVRVPFLPTPRNEPMRRFLDGLSAATQSAHDGAAPGTAWYRLSARDAAEVRLEFDVAPPTEDVRPASSDAASSRAASPAALASLAALASPASLASPEATTTSSSPPEQDLIVEIASKFSSASAVLAAIRTRRQRRRELTGYASPRDGHERSLAAIWQEVLGLDRVGVRDRFSDLGGTSLHLVRIHGLIVKRLGVDIDLTELFSHATIESLVGLFTTRTQRAPMAAVHRRAAAQKQHQSIMNSSASRLQATRRGATRR